MSSYRLVRQGECLSSIAAKAGLKSWEDIYRHPNNAKLREQRPNPNVILPGDRVFIPDITKGMEQGATEQRHEFRLLREPSVLKICLLDEAWQPLAHKSYTLTIGLEVREGSLDGDGKFEETIPVDIQSIKLMVVLAPPDDTASWTLNLKHLDPVEEIVGIQERLNNLSLAPGAIDGIVGSKTEEAIRRFQKAHGLEETGVIDAALRQKLKEIYGS